MNETTEKIEKNVMTTACSKYIRPEITVTDMEPEMICASSPQYDTYSRGQADNEEDYCGEFD